MALRDCGGFGWIGMVRNACKERWEKHEMIHGNGKENAAWIIIPMG